VGYIGWDTLLKDKTQHSVLVWVGGGKSREASTTLQKLLSLIFIDKKKEGGKKGEGRVYVAHVQRYNKLREGAKPPTQPRAENLLGESNLKGEKHEKGRGARYIQTIDEGVKKKHYMVLKRSRAKGSQGEKIMQTTKD